MINDRNSGLNDSDDRTTRTQSTRSQSSHRNLQNDQTDQLYQLRIRKQLARSQRDVERHFHNVMEQQAQMYQSMTQDMNESDRQMLRNRMSMMNNQLEDELKRYKQQYKTYSKFLDRNDKQAFKVVYKNRRDDLRKLEREARYRFEEIEQEGTDAFNNIGDSASDLIDIVNAINLNQLADSLGEAAQSFVDTKREISKQLNLSEEEWETYSDNISKTVSDLHNKISRSDVAVVSQQVVNWGVKDVDAIDKYTRALSKNQLSNNIDPSALEGLFKLDFAMDKNGEILEDFGDTLKALTNKGFSISNDSMAEVTSNIAGSLDNISGGNDEVTQKLLEEFMASSAAAGNQSVNNILDPIMQEIASSTTQGLGELATKYGGVDVMGIRNQMNQGDMEGAYMTMAEALKNGTNNQALLDYLRENMGIEDTDLAALRRLDTGQLKQDMESANNALADKSGSMDSFIEDMSIGVGKEVSNAFGNSWLGKKLGDFLDNTGLDFGDVLTGGAIINNLSGGALTKGLSSLLGKGGSLLSKGAGSLLGKLGNTGIGSWLSGTKLGSKLLGSAGRVNAGTLAKVFGTSADDIVSTFGKGASYSIDDIARVMGTSADDVGKLLASGGDDAARAAASLAGSGGGALSKLGSFASKASGPLAIAGVALDGILGGFKTKDWFGETAGIGDTVSSVIGGALGGTGPGVVDKGSVLEKGLNIGGGALKGAGVGALIGSVVPGLGTAIGGGIGAVVGAVGSAIGGGNIAKALSWTGGKLKDAGSWCVDKLQDAGDWIGDKLTDTGKLISDEWSSFKDDPKQFLTDKLNAAEDAFNDKVSWLGEKAGDLGDAIGDKCPILSDALTTMGSIFGDSNTTLSEKLTSLADTIGSGIESLWESFKDSDVGQAIGDKVSWVGGKISDGASWIGSKLGFADGLSNVPFDGFPAILHAGESVLTASQSSILRNTVADGGIDTSSLLSTQTETDKVTNRKTTESLLNTSETSSDILDNLVSYFKQTHEDNKNIITTFKRTGIFGSLLSMATRGSGTSLLGRLFSGLTGLTGGSGGFGGSSGSSGSFGGGATGTGGMSGSGSGLDVLAFHPNLEGSGANRWRDYAIDALKANGLSTSEDMVNKVIKQINSESSGDPKAINNWDSNAKAGHPSKGLLQTIDSTFNSYKFSGHDDIWNGYDNMLAAINYAKNRYGNSLVNSSGNGLGSGHGYAVGTPWIPDDQVAVVHKGEMIVPASNNPFNVGTVSSVPTSSSTDNLDTVVNVIKWAVNRLEKKSDEIIDAINSNGTGNSYAATPTVSTGPSHTDIAFSF